MDLSQKQIETKTRIETFARLLGVDPVWATAVAMTESSLGEFQESPTHARGVFQMTSIAMKDILYAMSESNDDWDDILCGLIFLRILIKRWKTWEEATRHFCDPADRKFYVDRVRHFMSLFKN